MENLIEQVSAAVALYAPRVLGAAAILGVGWLIAMGVSSGVRALLRRTSIDDRLAGWMRGGSDTRRVDAAGPVSKVVYYLILAFVLVAAFQVLGLTLITEPLNSLLNEVFRFAPKLLAGVALLAVALVLATVCRFGLHKMMDAARVDERLAEGANGDAERGVSRPVADAVYWLVLLLFLPAILGALGLEGLLGPVQNLTNELLGFLPNLLGAGIVLAVGWFVARIVQRIVTNLLAAAGLDRVGERFGASMSKRPLSGVVGTIVYALLLIPVIIGALEALQLDAVTAPVTAMLHTIVGAIPNVATATVLVLLAVLVGRVVSSLVSSVLQGIGFDRVPGRLGLLKDDAQLARSPSAIVGTLVLVAIVLFASMEAASLLGFASIGLILAQLLEFGGHVLLGMVVLGVGLFLADLAARAVKSSTSHAMAATVARVAVVALTVAMALRQMGFANEIVNLAFGLLLGAVAVALALAFGLGGRDAAARQVETWRGAGASATGGGTDAVHH